MFYGHELGQETRLSVEKLHVTRAQLQLGVQSNERVKEKWEFVAEMNLISGPLQKEYQQINGAWEKFGHKNAVL